MTNQFRHSLEVAIWNTVQKNHLRPYLVFMEKDIGWLSNLYLGFIMKKIIQNLEIRQRAICGLFSIMPKHCLKDYLRTT